MDLDAETLVAEMRVYADAKGELQIPSEYRAMKSKSIKALGKLRFLENYTGILFHDHEEASCHFGTGHAECNVHIIRRLRKNTQETGRAWSDEMIPLLSKINKSRKAE